MPSYWGKPQCYCGAYCAITNFDGFCNTGDNMGNVAYIEGLPVSELNERMAKVETNVEHIQDDVDEMKGMLKEQTKAMTDIACTLKEMNGLGKRVDTLEKKQQGILKKLACISGGFAAVMWFFADQIKALFLG